MGENLRWADLLQTPLVTGKVGRLSRSEGEWLESGDRLAQESHETPSLLADTPL